MRQLAKCECTRWLNSLRPNTNHQIEYSGIYGENNNQSESYNARFRRMQYGNLHKIGNLYLSNYANEIAYREDTRKMV